MRATVLWVLTASLIAITAAGPAAAGWRGRYEVYGVENDDMLKMRTGPGVGYTVIVGLPNGTVVRVDDCEQIGSTRWCSISLDRARSLKGYVSWAYLREM
jgi:uncharacterized protein YraI